MKNIINAIIMAKISAETIKAIVKIFDFFSFSS
jgi:hypothetical protein